MGTFKTNKILNCSQDMIPAIAECISNEFRLDGFAVQNNCYGHNIYDISLAKGNTFKAVLGMNSALKITLRPEGNGVYFEAGIGIFGQQAIPTAISMFFFWPVLVPQIWGLVKQSQLDDKALAIAEKVIAENGNQAYKASESCSFVKSNFCPHCGLQVNENAKFCSNCGKEL